MDFARQMEAAGMSFIAIHGRTQKQRSEPVCTQTIAAVKAAVSVPVVANGGVRSMKEACALKEVTGADGLYVCLYFNFYRIWSFWQYVFFLATNQNISSFSFSSLLFVCTLLEK